MSPITSVNIIVQEDGDSSPLNHAAVLVTRNEGILIRLREMLNQLVFFGYSLILICHVIGWLLFTVYANYCFFTQRSTTQRCKNFDFFSHPKEFEVCWQVVTGINALTYILLTQKLGYADASSFSLKKLLRIPRALRLLLGELTIAVSYEMMMFLHEEVTSAKAIEIGFIWRNICVTSLVFFLNFTWAPRERKYKVFFFSTLVVFFLDHFIMTSMMTCHVYFRITALKSSQSSLKADDEIASNLFQGMITIMTVVGVFSLHSSLLRFFWSKLFESNKNLLRKGLI